MFMVGMQWIEENRKLRKSERTEMSVSSTKLDLRYRESGASCLVRYTATQ